MKKQNIDALYQQTRDNGDFHNTAFITALKDYGTRWGAKKMRRLPSDVALAFAQSGSPENIAYSAIIRLLRVIERGGIQGDNVGGFFTKTLDFTFRAEFKALAEKHESGTWVTKGPQFVSVDSMTEEEREEIEDREFALGGERDRAWEYCEQFYADSSREQQVVFDMLFDFNPVDGGFKKRSIEQGASEVGLSHATAKRLVSQVKKQYGSNPNQASKPAKTRPLNQFETVEMLKRVAKENNIAWR